MSVKLQHIKIKGFKDPNRVVDFTFSDEKITVIHGENGSGKTTFLKIIQAVLNKNAETLKAENVQSISITYKIRGVQKKTTVSFNNGKPSWGKTIKDLTETSSILFGVHRGVIQDSISNDYTNHDLQYILRHFEELLFRERTRASMQSMRLIDDIKFLLSRNMRQVQDGITTDAVHKKNHIAADFIKIHEIEKTLINQFKNGEKTASDAIKNAFFNTVENGVEIESDNEEYTLPSDFMIRFQSKKDLLLPILNKLDKTKLQKRLIALLEKGDEKEILNSKIFRALLLNILDKAEEENLVLKSISKLIEAFNSHLYRNKKLVVDSENATIVFDKSKNGNHALDKLSSGERHLLSFLTLFLIIGEGRTFFLIDEPEISLNMKWQAKLLPLLSELSPESQIIVATHSPSIANRNSNYLSELI